MARRATQSASDRFAVGPDGLRYMQGMMGDIEHAETILRDRVMDVFEWSAKDLLRLAATLTNYAHGRDLTDIAERVERLEKGAKRPARRTRRAA